MNCPLPHRALVAGAIALAAGMAQPVAAQNIYRSVGADGRVTFSDRASPAAASAAAAAASGPAAMPQLPYALRQIQARYPVALYSADDCSPCSNARALLVARGIPFSEYTVQTDADVLALQALSGQNQLPFATIGRQHLAGFSAEEWRQYLDAAGYPQTSTLPASYRQTPARALAPSPAASAAEPAAAPSAAERRTAPASRVTPNNPAGLSF